MRTAKTLGMLALGIVILGWEHYSEQMQEVERWRTPWGYVTHIVRTAIKANR